MPDAAAERQPGDARRADDPTGAGEPECLGRPVEVRPRRAAVGARDRSARVDFDGAHRGEVDHQPVVADAVAGRIVSASPNRDLELVRPREVERRRDVCRADASHDHRGASVDQGVVTAACVVVSRVGRLEDRAGKRAPELRDVHR